MIKRLIEYLREHSKRHKLTMSICTAPNGDLRIQVFSERSAGPPIEGSDMEITFAQNNDTDKCAEIALMMLQKWIETR